MQHVQQPNRTITSGLLCSQAIALGSDREPTTMNITLSDSVRDATRRLCALALHDPTWTSS